METKTVTVRLPLDEFTKLDELARQRRKETGDAVTKSQLIREALGNMGKSQKAPSLLTQALNCPDDDESIRLALEVVATLAQDAAQRGLLTGVPQELGMAVFSACEGHQDIDLLTDYLSKLHGALRAV